MTMTAPSNADYRAITSERIHAFQIKDGINLLGYIWFSEYEPENAAGVLIYAEAGEPGARAANYWRERLQERAARGQNASDAVLDLREQVDMDEANGVIDYAPITAKNLNTLAERSTHGPTALDAVTQRRQDMFR